jgi:hypothetical protein
VAPHLAVIVREGGRSSTPRPCVESLTSAITGYPAFAGYDEPRYFPGLS